MTRSIEDNISICVGTVRRPYCIQRFIKSVRANFPLIPIIVGDQDKPDRYLDAFYQGAGVNAVYVAEDAGVGVARNAAVAKAKTGYVLICDDDFVFSHETKVEAPMQILEHDQGIDIVGGAVRDIIGPIDAPFWKIRRWEKFFVLDRKRRHLISTNIDEFTPLRKNINGITYFLADAVLNWKLLRKSAFERWARWDTRFKCNGEHNDFYLNIKENTDIGVAYCPSFIVYHHSPEDFSYAPKREQQDGFRKLSEKWGIDEVLDIEHNESRVILANGWTSTPQSATADPTWAKSGAIVPIGGGAAGPLDAETWPASKCVDEPSALSTALRVFFPDGAVDIAVKDGAKFSLHVAIENRSGKRIGCLGERRLSLSYRVRRQHTSEIASEREHVTALNHDLTPGVTFHFVNIIVDWDAAGGETFELEIDLLSPHIGWLNQHSTATLTVEKAAMNNTSSMAASEVIIDFKTRELTDFLSQTRGLSNAEEWGRWSDANLSDAVMLRFFEPLPQEFLLELTCRAFGPNADNPVLVEIGKSIKTIWPTDAMATYYLDFVLDGTERTIKLRPSSPASPASLIAGNTDNRRLGIGLVELKLTSKEPKNWSAASAQSVQSQPETSCEELAFWERLYSKEDPWNYKGPYEQIKYARTLELLPQARILRALEIGCAEGLFTEMLAPRVEQVLGLDISELALSRARARCQRFGNVAFVCADISDQFPPGIFDLITCSEVLYYLRDRFALKKVVRQIARSLAPNGHLLMANANSVNDDRTVTGFDFSEIGAVFMGQAFAEELEFEFLKELRTPLYRVQLFRRREVPHAADTEPLDVRKSPREVTERPATFAHPELKWGGCSVTFAEAKYFYDTVQIPILMYHRIASDGPPDLLPYRLDPAAFERQLAYLQRYGYSTILVDDIWRSHSASSSPKPGKWIALSFDDGYQDFADVAWPLLKHYGFNATVFLTTDYIGGHAEWDSEYGEPAPLMGWETIRWLAKEGVSFGSHSCSHRRMTCLPPTEVPIEVERSRQVLKDGLSALPQGFCYPYSDFNPAVMGAVKKAGYDYAAAGSVPREFAANPLALPRIEIRNDDDLDKFIAKLPPPLPSSTERRDEYRRLHSLRHCATYFDAASSVMSDDRPIGSGAATTDDHRTGTATAASGDLRTGSGAATSDDVVRLYRNLLAREPESSLVVEQQVGRPLVEVATEFALCDEFSKRFVTEAKTAADIAELHELLLPDIPLDAEVVQEIARIAKLHGVGLPAVARHMAAMERAKRAAERGERFAGVGWTEPLTGDFRQNESFGDKIEIVVPTINSERWLGHFLEFYKSNGIRVVYAVDRRTSDGTRELITKYGFPFIDVRADQPRVEALLPSIAAQIAVPWILRLDDDELPTPNLLNYAAAVAASDSIAAHIFVRACLRYNAGSGRLERSYFFAFGPDGGLERQCRLYRPESVTYHGDLHSRGFSPVAEKSAPPDIYMLHFDWVLRSEQARRMKFENYERQSPLAARNFKHHTLYENVPDAWHIFGVVQDEKLQRFARNLNNIL
jgi:peptidoglycan/xylan/chitin deacetylase (PgdA/CDA1 family)/2-polyprenyl-3-methyl-5-hydroxy-6-metoxy-1,4-benzoquinol methylase/glycosyltransferase involved in cell wall biosynthesis